jgi:flagellar protein FliJ
MKSRERALQLKRHDYDEKARKAADLGHTIRELECVAADLDDQIRAEEDRTGIKDPQHFAYSTFAKSASVRRDKLRTSVAALRVKLEVALRERDEAAKELEFYKNKPTDRSTGFSAGAEPLLQKPAPLK